MIKYQVYVHEDGSKFCYLNCELHCEDGPAIERSDGTKVWYLNGKRHREYGPAIERSDGTKEWFLNGELHREDGPAVERSNGTKEYYLNGEQLSEAEWRKQVSRPSCEGKEVEIDGVTYVLKMKGQDDE